MLFRSDTPAPADSPKPHRTYCCYIHLHPIQYRIHKRNHGNHNLQTGRNDTPSPDRPCCTADVEFCISPACRPRCRAESGYFSSAPAGRQASSAFNSFLGHGPKDGRLVGGPGSRRIRGLEQRRHRVAVFLDHVGAGYLSPSSFQSPTASENPSGPSPRSRRARGLRARSDQWPSSATGRAARPPGRRRARRWNGRLRASVGAGEERARERAARLAASASERFDADCRRNVIAWLRLAVSSASASRRRKPGRISGRVGGAADRELRISDSYSHRLLEVGLVLQRLGHGQDHVRHAAARPAWRRR